MNLSQLTPKNGSRHRSKRIGCGYGSGHGKTSTRGMKGQRSRSGDGKQIGFEGGQMPLLRRIPKRGFSNADFRVEYAVVNLSQLQAVFASGAVTPEILREKGVIRSGGPIKVLGDGDLKGKLEVRAHAFSKSAKDKIEKAGGSCAVIAPTAKWQRAKKAGKKAESLK